MWKEKVVHNAVRPTTVVHEIINDDIVETYAGPFQGTAEIKGTDWQPYIRTMPHAEYPSGSACICTVYAETLQLLTGTDNTGVTLSQEILAGSSKAERGLTPATNLTLVYDHWSEIARDCGESRLYGGMHFEEAVTAGNELCSGFIDPVVDNADLLLAGDSGGALFDKDAGVGILVTPDDKTKLWD